MIVLGVVLAIAIDQCLVMLAKVDAQSSARAVDAAFPDEALSKQGRHAAAAERKAILAAQGERTASEGIDVPDRKFEIVGDIIGRADRVEEAIGKGECRHARHHGRNIESYRFVPDDAADSPSAQVILTFRSGAGDVQCGARNDHTAVPIPARIGAVDTEKADGRVAPEHVSGAAGRRNY